MYKQQPNETPEQKNKQEGAVLYTDAITNVLNPSSAV
jgi:hypothetical protein